MKIRYFVGSIVGIAILTAACATHPCRGALQPINKPAVNRPNPAAESRP